ncbi:hypothetical protein [Salininema proteolyticum]|uniref:Alpha amylase inhibitor n=1 Tax=Salininema proteolyticum TaxID=1607685 RepID=A0ABV8TTH3_9ACTN
MKTWLKKTVVTGAMAVIASGGIMATTSTAAQASYSVCIDYLETWGYDITSDRINACAIGSQGAPSQRMICQQILDESGVMGSQSIYACQRA